MTEAEWLAFDDPWTLHWDYLKRFSGRKLRLCAIAACRSVAHLLCQHGRQALEVAEQVAEGRAERAKREAAEKVVHDLIPTGLFSAYGAVSWAFASYPPSQVMQMACKNAGTAGGLPTVLYANLLRDILGNPFRPVAIDSTWLAWNDAMVKRLAEAAYEERELPGGTLDSSRLAVLADALADAGAPNGEVLEGLRGPGPHYRGFWCLDVLLGKS
jgi:hypothetical protein